MKSVTLRTLLREPLKVKRMTRAGAPVQVTDKGEPLWVLHPAANTRQTEVERRREIEQELQSVLRVYDVRDLIASDAALHAQRIEAATATIRAVITAGGGTPATVPATTRAATIDPQHEQYLDSVERLKLVITETVDPESWREAGGTVGSIREFNGQLVVTQTPVAHDRIAKLLQDLRHK